MKIESKGMTGFAARIKESVEEEKRLSIIKKSNRQSKPVFDLDQIKEDFNEANELDELTANYDVIDIKNPDGPLGDFHKKAVEVLVKYY